jgi:tellurite resistance protein
MWGRSLDVYRASMRAAPPESLLHRLSGGPASLFGMVLGIEGLASAWRVAERSWNIRSGTADALGTLGASLWCALLALYAMKWLLRPRDALAELEHPVQCCFVGLVGVATMLVGVSITPHAPGVARVVIALGAAGALGFAAWRTGRLWQGGRDPSTTTPILYLPSVAASFVAASAIANLGWRAWAELAFGAGLFSWLAIESVVLQRLYTAPMLAAPLRPTLGIQLAPPAVACAAYLELAPADAGIFPAALLGYALVQAVLLLRLVRWIRAAAFAPAYWSFTFGATALAADSMRLAGRNAALATLAPWLFVVANALVALVAAGTLRLWFRAAPPAQPEPSPSMDP